MNRPFEIASFPINWGTLVTTHAPATHPYLDAIAAYSNLAEGDEGVFARRFGWRADAAFDALLATLNAHPTAAPALAAHLFARTALAESLTSFHPDSDGLAAAVEAVPLEVMTPAGVVGELADYL